MKKLIASVIIVANLIVGIQMVDASAPCPINQTQEQSFQSATHVFAGAVATITPSGDQWYPDKVTFSVTKYWKGTVYTTHTIHALSGQFVNGSQYIVYLLGTGNQNSYCIIRTINAVQINDETIKLGQGNVPSQFIPNPQPPVATSFTRNLTIGSTGSDVVLLQDLLIRGGYLTMPQGVAKGYFGQLTRKALSQYQWANGISPAVGYFGPITRAHIMSGIVVN